MSKLLAVTEQLIEMMKTSPEQFAIGAKFDDLDLELLELIRGERLNRADCYMHMLPAVDQTALIDAYREHIVGHRLMVHITKLNLGEIEESVRSRREKSMRSVGGLTYGSDYWIDLPRAALAAKAAQVELAKSEQARMPTGWRNRI